MVIIQFLFTKDILFILLFIEIFAYFLQYSNLNYKQFVKYDQYKSLSLGRFFEILPFCITGYILASLKIINHFKNFKIKTIFLILINIILITKYNILNVTKGFDYQNIDLHILSVSIFIIISLFPSNNLKNKLLIKIIKLITNYTSGIYYLHIPIRNYFISFIGIKVFGKTKLRHLFQ